MALPLLIFNTVGAPSGVFGVTTPAGDTTGVKTLMLFCAGVQPNAVSDNMGNVYQPGSTAFREAQLFYCENPTVGPGHTFTVNGLVVNLYVQGWDTALTFDQQSGLQGSAVTVKPGALTPPVNGAVFVTGVASQFSQSYSIDSGFNISDQFPGSGVAVPGAFAGFAQAVAGALDPEWTQNNGGSMDAAMMTFIPAGGSVIELTGIASSFAAGNPTMVAAGSVVPDGIPSSFAAGAITLHATATIVLTGIPSSFAAGTPTLIEGSGGGGGHGSAWYWSGPAARMLADAGFLLLVLPELERQELEEAAAK